MKTKTITITAATAAFVALSAIAFAGRDGRSGSGDRHGHGGWGGFHADPDRIVDMLDRRVDLTGEQQDRIEELLEARFELIEQERTAARTEMRALIEADSITEADVRELLEGHVDRHQVMTRHLPGVIAEVHGVLTPEQRTELAEMVEQGGWHRGRDGKGRGRHGHFRWGG